MPTLLLITCNSEQVAQLSQRDRATP